MSGDYCEYLVDMLQPWGAVTVRKMFGGFGLYRSDLTFAIVVDDTLYFKVDASNRADYEAAGSAPFSYEARGKMVTMSYWQVPAEVLDDEHTLCEWAEKAYAVAVAAKTAKPAKPKAKAAGGARRQKKTPPSSAG